MSPLRTSFLIAILAMSSACGRQIVEFQLDGGTDIDAPVDAPSEVRPIVTSTLPASDATGVALNTSPTATFSKPMNAGTLTATTFTLRQGSTELVGVVTVDAAGTTATFNPSADLTAGLVYTATITTGAQDTTGLALAANYTWMFTAAPNALPPTVISTTPAPNATNVSLNVSPTATFSKAMNPTTINATTFTLSQGATPIAGVVSLNSATNTATFNPTANLTAGLVYTARITTGAQDTGGLALAAIHTWTFTTGVAVLPPTVILTTPAPNATNVALTVSPTATFSQAMNPATINATTFTLMQGATPIAGVVTYDALTNTATFNPTVDLTAGLIYTATITTGAQDTNGLALAAPFMWTFTTAVVVLPPTVTMTTPTPNAMNVPVNVSPTATFSRAMNPTTINATTFTLAQGATPIAGVVTYDALTNTATFNPTVDLTAGLDYTATITTGAQDTNGLALAAPFMWMFTTGAVVLPPTVTMTTPLPNAMNVPVNVSPTATFSRPMNMLTINTMTFTLSLGATPITGAVSYDNLTNTATFDPTMDLAPGTYTATITTGAQDTNGVPLAAPHTWMFTVGMNMAPTVTMTTPLPNAMNVPINVSPTATFSQSMNAATINMTTFTLSLGVTPIAGMVMYNALTNTATFDPMNDLAPGTYTARITTGAQGTNNLFLAMDHTWTFTVGMQTACVLPPILLGTAGNFAVLAGSTVTSTGLSIVNSNLGVFPGTAVVGFPPGVVNNGAIIAGTAVAGTAQDDLTIAHVDGLGRTDCLTSLVGDLGGMTLAPGLYKSTSFFEITTADLILDSQGDPNAVWIFAAAARIDVANNRMVTIIGPGSAANVFWVAGSSVALGTGVRMVGNILADQAITMATGAVLNGRALARIAEVTLDATTVTPP